MHDSFEKQKIPARIDAVVNDTVGTLLACAFEKKNVRIGLILGLQRLCVCVCVCTYVCVCVCGFCFFFSFFFFFRCPIKKLRKMRTKYK